MRECREICSHFLLYLKCNFKKQNMTTEEILRVINNSYIKTITELINRSEKIFPDISPITIIDKQDMGLSGTLATARFNNGTDEIYVRGFLYLTELWSEDTCGYIVAKKL